MAGVISTASLPKSRRIQEACRTVMIASGKGGVGKSTIAANVAVGLARRNLSVGLLDLDVFGPSIPRLMGLEGREAEMDDDTGAFLPIRNYGVRCMSMGFLLKPYARKAGEANEEPQLVAWRGLMVMKAIQQLLWSVRWPILDFLILDMPPGTGDTQLTVCQQLVIDAALIISTPQPVALAASEKGLLLLRRMGVPVKGIVENMKWLDCVHCGGRNQLFASHTEDLAARYQLPIITSIPMDPRIAAGSDQGRPITIEPNEPYSRLIDHLLMNP